MLFLRDWDIFMEIGGDRLHRLTDRVRMSRNLLAFLSIARRGESHISPYDLEEWRNFWPDSNYKTELPPMRG